MQPCHWKQLWSWHNKPKLASNLCSSQGGQTNGRCTRPMSRVSETLKGRNSRLEATSDAGVTIAKNQDIWSGIVGHLGKSSVLVAVKLGTCEANAASNNINHDHSNNSSNNINRVLNNSDNSNSVLNNSSSKGLQVQGQLPQEGTIKAKEIMRLIVL